MNKLAQQRRGDCCITRGVDSGEKTLDTTIGNECKFSRDRTGAREGDTRTELKRGEKRHRQKLVP